MFRCIVANAFRVGWFWFLRGHSKLVKSLKIGLMLSRVAGILIFVNIILLMSPHHSSVVKIKWFFLNFKDLLALLCGLFIIQLKIHNPHPVLHNFLYLLFQNFNVPGLFHFPLSSMLYSRYFGYWLRPPPK